MNCGKLFGSLHFIKFFVLVRGQCGQKGWMVRRLKRSGLVDE